MHRTHRLKCLITNSGCFRHTVLNVLVDWLVGKFSVVKCLVHDIFLLRMELVWNFTLTI